MSINRNAAEPLYLQLAAELREQIEAGTITDRVPSITALAAEHDLATVTVRKALDVLRAEGLLVSVPGRGSFLRTSN